MRLLITRPEADARDLADRLRALGHDPLAAPMLDIAFADGPDLDASGFDGVLATSANGVRALARRSAERGVPVFAVGDATARTARSLGFETVRSAAGDVDTLADLVERTVGAPARFLHVAGTAVAGDLAGRLGAAGHTVERVVLYDARLRDRLDAETRAALDAGTVDGVLIFSPRTAKAFAAAVQSGPGADAAAGCVLFALSDAVAAAADLPWRRIVVAPSPDSEALIAAVGAARE
jgi:uroporphyrinogen-III synthase